MDDKTSTEDETEENSDNVNEIIDNKYIDFFKNANFSYIESEVISYNSKEIRVSEIEYVKNCVYDFLDFYNTSVSDKLKKEFLEKFLSLNEKTKEKLKNFDITSDSLKNIINNFSNTFCEKANKIAENLKQIIEEINEINAENDGSTDVGENPKYDTGDGSSSSHTSSADTSTIDDTTVIDQETLTKLMPAVTGMITFSEIVSMFETIGGTPIQSSTTGQYGLIGVVQENGKYYYKILDTKTGKVYYTEITEKSKITWGENGEKKVIEVNDDNAMILKQTGESEDGFVRFADKGDVYLLADDKTTVDEIDYYSIMDSKTDSKLFMVSSSSVSEPKTISDLISAVDEEVIK